MLSALAWPFPNSITLREEGWVQIEMEYDRICGLKFEGRMVKFPRVLERNVK